MPTLQGRILSPAGWLDGSIRFDERVLEVAPGPVPHGAPFVVPGFVDVHVHGGGGGDTMDGAGGIRTLAAFHARHGTTALLATTITNPWDRVVAALGAVLAVMLEGPGDGARVLGAHLEGPFISPHRLGAQPPFTVHATAARLRSRRSRASRHRLRLSIAPSALIAMVAINRTSPWDRAGHRRGRPAG